MATTSQRCLTSATVGANSYAWWWHALLNLFHAIAAASAFSAVSSDRRITKRDRILGRSISTPSATQRSMTNSSNA
ncbi:hypothetical protein HQO38_20485 [Rhodococcus fascians]|nr:hypothetical protein [Rhodococcus fascians]MBY4140265.1 hypothetical protein [Rhodococcus fascians]MBY4218930.1 hypothetical protein [Rhodococcus fascians]MBY4223806.1 hypothetical protein [Rhodococcus fascians]MBY4234291.1 hypothetical protein [Rhodococcus fascians]